MPTGTLSLASSLARNASAASALQLLGNAGGDLGRHVDQHLRALGRHEVTDHAREARGAVILAREADRDADGEQQAEVREDGVAGGGDGRHVEQVGLARAAAAARRPAAPRWAT